MSFIELLKKTMFQLFARRFSFTFITLVCCLAGLGLRAADAASGASPVPDKPVGVNLPVQLTFPGKGFASVAVYNAGNEMIRSLAYALPVKAGAQTFTWDGTTDLGLPAEPGKYHVHGVWFTEGPKIDYVMKVGLSGEPPYLTDDPNSGWGAVHGPAMAICANDKNLLAIFQITESPRETGIQLMDFNGKIVSRFSSFFPFDWRLACTMDDTTLYLADFVNAYGKKGLFIGKYNLAQPPRGKILCQLPITDHVSTSGADKGAMLAKVEGLALLNGRLYVPVTLDNTLFVVDSATGEILRTVTVPSPHGVAAHDGKIYLLSETSLYQIDADGASVGLPILTGLDDPSGLAIDAQGNFYISDGGASQQVKVFTPDGKPLRQIGIKGGRPRNGLYDPKGMLDPNGLCVAPDGKVWVAEIADDFQELTEWNPDGTRANAFYNTHWASGQGRLSPDRTEMYFNARPGTSNQGLTSYKLDLEHGTWKPYWHLSQTEDMMDQRDVLLGYEPVSDREKVRYDHHMPYLSFERETVQGTNGKTYMVGGDFSIWLFNDKTKTVKLASLVFGHHVMKTPAGPYQANNEQGPSNWLAWADLNGDGKMSLDETTCTKNPPLLDHVPNVTEMVLNPDLSITMLVRFCPKSIYIPTRWTVCSLKPQKVLPSGVPVYDWGDLQKVTDLQVPDFAGGDHDPNRAVTRVQALFPKLANDALYVQLEPGSKTRLHLTGVDGEGWWASRNWRLTPEKFDLKTGAPAWLKLGRRAPGIATPGEMYYPGWGLAGSSHGVDFYADTLSQVWAWTDDGLYLGPVYNNDGKAVYNANSLFVELIGAYIYDIKGTTYILAGDHGVSVHRMTLPTLTPVDGGTLSLTPELAAQVKSWDPDGPPPGKRPTYIARTVFDFDKAARKNIRTITIDGKLDPAEWDGVPPMDLDLDGKKVGTVQVTFDKTNLYLAYDVQDPNGLKNDGHELPLAPFVSGSYVDFDLGRDWSTPNRPDVADGDVRVILAKISGSNSSDYQMGFWPIRKNLNIFNPKPRTLNPQDIVSPAQQRHFEDVSPVPGLTFAYQITDRGYTLEVKVPFASLGIDPIRHPVVGFDASVAFSDASGTVRTRATHWAGESEAEVVDRPGSAELKPRTWGTLEFNLNPLPPVAGTPTSTPGH